MSEGAALELPGLTSFAAHRPARSHTLASRERESSVSPIAAGDGHRHGQLRRADLRGVRARRRRARDQLPVRQQEQSSVGGQHGDQQERVQGGVAGVGALQLLSEGAARRRQAARRGLAARHCHRGGLRRRRAARAARRRGGRRGRARGRAHRGSRARRGAGCAAGRGVRLLGQARQRAARAAGGERRGRGGQLWRDRQARGARRCRLGGAQHGAHIDQGARRRALARAPWCVEHAQQRTGARRAPPRTSQHESAGECYRD
mmetsp:Transcript_48133/g.159534  ORF Transcript_48133/g.159534 Transcript_48133/m.159534 type:complete len:261 (-) Transcript_48133:75-857(-)